MLDGALPGDGFRPQRRQPLPQTGDPRVEVVPPVIARGYVDRKLRARQPDRWVRRDEFQRASGGGGLETEAADR